MTYIAGDTYLRFKRANLRFDYLEMLDMAEKKAIKKEKKKASRFNATTKDPLSAFDTYVPEKPVLKNWLKK